MFQLMLEPLRKYAVFKGRASRAEFWLFIAFSVVFPKLAATLSHAVDSVGAFAQWTQFLLMLALASPSIAVTVRRLHDRDKSGWWALLLHGTLWAMVVGSVLVFAFSEPGFLAAFAMMLGFAIVIWMSVVLARRGTRGPNRYGDDPVASPVAETFA